MMRFFQRRKVSSLILACCLSSTLYAYHDMGVWGTQYGIVESIEFKEPSKPILEDAQIEKSFQEALISRQTLPECVKTVDRHFDPTVVLEHDIDMPKYNIHIKKGTKFNYLQHKKMQRYMIMIDGGNGLHVEFAKHYLPVSDVVIYNGSTEVISEWLDGHIYIADESFQKAFKVKCLPSVFIQENETFLIREYNLKEVLNEK